MADDVLIAGPSFYHYLSALKNLFLSNGCRCHVVEYNYKGSFFSKKADRINIQLFNQEIINQARKQKVGKAIIVLGKRVRKATLLSLKDMNIRIILFLQDGLYRSIPDYSVLSLFDKILLFEDTDREMLSEIGIYNTSFFGSAVSFQTYFPCAPERQEHIDISFVGRIDRQRERIINEIIKSFPDLKIKVYGNYLFKRTPRRWMAYLFRGYRYCYQNRTIPFKDVNTLYHQSKICLNIQHSQSKWGCNPRTYEILASKSFQLTSSTPFIEKEFEGGGLATFQSIDELKAKIDRYRSDPELRRYHAEIGYQYVKQHAYEKKYHHFKLDESL